MNDLVSHDQQTTPALSGLIRRTYEQIVVDNPASVLKVFIVILIVIAGVLALRPEPYSMAAPLTDDGYYAFSVSRNIALGKGITIDGEHVTNGFQPLFVFLTVPAFLFAGEDTVDRPDCP